MAEKKKQEISFNDIIFEADAVAKDVEIEIDDLDEPIICDLKYISQSAVNAIRKQCKLYSDGDNDKKYYDKAKEFATKVSIRALKKWNFTPQMLKQLVPVDLNDSDGWDKPIELGKSTLEGIFKHVPGIANAIALKAQKGKTFDKEKGLAKN